jgi:hypothetical protein
VTSLGFFSIVGLGLEIAPEFGKHLLPRRGHRHVVELVFHAGREFIGDIAIEEPFEEGGQHAPAFLGKEAVLLDPHIGAVFQHLNVAAYVEGRPMPSSSSRLTRLASE